MIPGGLYGSEAAVRCSEQAVTYVGVLRSPGHRSIGRRLAPITATGRPSSRALTLQVQYRQ